MLRFVTYALPLLILLLALFGLAVEMLDVEPTRGSVIKLALLDQDALPAQLVFGTWLVEASGLLALFLLAQGRCGTWWLDGLVAGWLGWVFRGPLLVVTIVVAARQPHHAWWTLAFGWWVLYSVAGVSLAILARQTELDLAVGASGAEKRHAKLAEQRRIEAAATQPVPVETPVEPDDSEERDVQEPPEDAAEPDDSEEDSEAPWALETQPMPMIRSEDLPEKEAPAEDAAEEVAEDPSDEEAPSSDDSEPSDSVGEDARRSPWEKPRPGEDA